MVGKFGYCVIIALILSSTTELQAARKDIYNFDDDQLTVDNKTLAVAALTRKCIFNRKMSLVVSEKVDDKLIGYLHRSEITSITSLASSKLSVEEWYFAASKNKEWYDGHNIYRFLSKSGGFLIAASSPPNLKTELDIMKSSRWWNPAGFFILIDEGNPDAERCSNAYEFLSLAWKYGLLSSVYFCQEQDENLSIYTYNPYGDSAPQPWLKNREIKGQQGYPWSLFKWEKYDGRHCSCENIFFDKTRSLNGYPIQSSALTMSPLLYFNNSKTGFEKYKGEDGWTMRNIWEFLNASTVNIPLSDEDTAIGWVDDNGTFHGNLIDINSGKVEIGFNSMLLQPLWKVTTTYPHTSANLCFVTMTRGRIPWLISLTSISDKWTSICTLTVFFVAIIIFGYIDKRRYFSGFLNILRVFLSSSFIRPPKSTSLRIILCFVFILPIISYSTIQGKILSLIQNPQHHTEIDCIEDLTAMGYHMEGRESMKKFLPDGEIRDNFVAVNDLDDCVLKLYRHEPVACLSYCFSIEVKSSYYKSLHIGSNRSVYRPNQFIAKPDWPLIDRFNVVLRRIVEAGLLQYYRVMSIIEKSDTFEKDSDDTTAAVIRLRDFRYVFIGLGIGWVCGTLAFIGELIIGRSKRQKESKTRVRHANISHRRQAFKMSRLVNRMKL